MLIMTKTNHLHNPLLDSVTQPMRIFDIKTHIHLSVHCKTYTSASLTKGRKRGD